MYEYGNIFYKIYLPASSAACDTVLVLRYGTTVLGYGRTATYLELKDILIRIHALHIETSVEVTQC